MNKKLKKMVDEQAEDDGLWFIAETVPEAYLQQELRKLHAEIERHLTQQLCALSGGVDEKG